MKLFKLFFLAVILLGSACKTAKYANLSKGLYADVKTSKGDILCELYFEDTPLTIANFVSLAEGTNPNVSDSLKGRNFYDGLTFHRVIKDFMIQGGDPAGTGTGGPGYKFEDEFPKDSSGKLKHTHNGVGVLSMANSGIATNGSQFFITHKETPWLDGKHTVFGKVKYGQKILDSIEKGDLINQIRFIRVGDKAEEFDAAKVFIEELEKSKISKQNRVGDAKVIEEARYKKFVEDSKVFQETQGISKAKKTTSGLHILTLKKGKGKKFLETAETTIHYTISLADGKQIQSTVGKEPLVFTMSKQPMIAGVKEALLNMKEGGKVRLFIPYSLGYGERAYGPFPAKSDLVFDLEITKIGS
jgi:cyclophilin family peptidyl-prolyl cis-trans isomerase